MAVGEYLRRNPGILDPERAKAEALDAVIPDDPYSLDGQGKQPPGILPEGADPLMAGASMEKPAAAPTLPSMPDLTGAKTSGHVMPKFTTSKAGATPLGWDAGKWADPMHQTPKYVVGRIMSAYDLKNPEQRGQAISEIQQAYPGTTFNGKDRLTFPGGGVVDIFGAAGAGEYRPQWLSESEGDGSMPPASAIQSVLQPNAAAVAAGGGPLEVDYGPSELFQDIMDETGKPVDTPRPRAELMQDFPEALQARRSGGVSPYKRRALDEVMA